MTSEVSLAQKEKSSLRDTCGQERELVDTISLKARHETTRNSGAILSGLNTVLSWCRSGASCVRKVSKNTVKALTLFLALQKGFLGTEAFEVQNLNQIGTYRLNNAPVKLKPIMLTGNSTYRVYMLVKPSDSGILVPSLSSPGDLISAYGNTSTLDLQLSNLRFLPSGRYTGPISISTFAWDQNNAMDRSEGAIVLRFDGNKQRSSFSTPSGFLVENLNQIGTYRHHVSSVSLQSIVFSGSSQYSILLVVNPSDSGFLPLYPTPNDLVYIKGNASELNTRLSGPAFVPSVRYTGVVSILTLAWDRNNSADRAEGIITLSYDEKMQQSSLSSPTGFTVENINQIGTFGPHDFSVSLQPIMIKESSSNKYRFSMVVNPSNSGALVSRGKTPDDRIVSGDFAFWIHKDFAGLVFHPSGKYNGTISILTYVWDRSNLTNRAEGVIVLSYDENKQASSFSTPAGFTVENFNQTGTYRLNDFSVSLQPIILTGNSLYSVSLLVEPSGSGTLLSYGFFSPRERINWSAALSQINPLLSNLLFLPNGEYAGTITISIFAWDQKKTADRAEGVITLSYDEHKQASLLSTPAGFTVENFNQTGTYRLNDFSVSLQPMLLTGNSVYRVYLLVNPSDSGTLLSPNFFPGYLIELRKGRDNASILNDKLSGLLFLPSGKYNGTISILTIAYDSYNRTDRAEGVIMLHPVGSAVSTRLDDATLSRTEIISQGTASLMDVSHSSVSTQLAGAQQFTNYGPIIGGTVSGGILLSCGLAAAIAWMKRKKNMSNHTDIQQINSSEMNSDYMSPRDAQNTTSEYAVLPQAPIDRDYDVLVESPSVEKSPYLEDQHAQPRSNYGVLVQSPFLEKSEYLED